MPRETNATDTPKDNGETPADDADTPPVETEAEPEVGVEIADDIEIDEEIVAPDDDAVVVLDDEEEEEDEEEAEVAVVPAPRPAPRPQPGRPPSAKEEPPPPFAIGERVILIQNTRPRTGTPIGDYPVGSSGRVETVLSQTAIVRFDIAPDTKEVVAFTCLESAEKPPESKPNGPEPD
jgi:hypothetical protein